MIHPALLTLSPKILAAGEGFSLEAWQIGAIAFAFIGVVLLVTGLLERWEVGLHV
jgi:hypothetical protein